MNIDKSIEVLNTLIEINNDRIESYKTASRATEKHGLKNLFFEFQQTSQKCKSELIKEIKKLGGIPKEAIKINAVFFKYWIDLKATFICKDSNDIINSCKSNEHRAEQYYNNVLIHKLENLNFEQQIMLRKHSLLINLDNNKVRVLSAILLENKHLN
ncbi:PA2169 family four-helix-bundle protein [Flavobacterium sp. LT1R49]|uniref:PA2169 family four-helix-bundle protein n=1 Tax=Flavobacterium arabinosi TaxID=3398737 RepID=UPI003A85D3E9